MRSANRTTCASSVAGAGMDHGWCTMPSRTSHVRFRPSTVVLEVLDDAQALLVVLEGPAEERRERLLAEMTERRVPQVVAERDRLGEVLVEAERPGGGAGDLRDVERVGQPHPVVVALGRQEHLGLVLEPAERLGVDDAIAVALEGRPEVVVGLGTFAALGGVGDARTLRRQDLVLDLLGPLSGGDGGAHAPHRSGERTDSPVGTLARSTLGMATPMRHDLTALVLDPRDRVLAASCASDGPLGAGADSGGAARRRRHVPTREPRSSEADSGGALRLRDTAAARSGSGGRSARPTVTVVAELRVHPVDDRRSRAAHDRA